MSLPADSSIYTGAWINWSRGPLLGSTITLTQRNGSLLTAFLGIFVTAAGASFWRILCFLIHQRRAQEMLKDAIHHQQQAILRNSSTPGAAAWQMTLLVWHWRKIASNPILRSLPFVMLAVCNMVLFSIAGVFSAEVTKAAGNETLIQSPNCGFLLDSSLSSDHPGFEPATAINALDANDTLTASAYSRACYGETQSGLQCYQYPKSKIPWNNRTGLPCPFGDNICKDVGAFEMDTGLIDSHKALGINSRALERVEYRKVTTCSILRTKEYSYKFNSTDPYGQVQELMRYNYETSPDRKNNFTFQYNTNDAVGSSGYTLVSYPLLEGSYPNSPLNRTDADVSLLFLAPNTVTYNAPVYDPWFQATLPINMTGLDGKNFTQYTPNFWVGVLACADQFQFRNPANGKSSSLTSRSMINDGLDKLDLNDIQKATVISLYYTVGWGLTYYSVRSRGANGLRAYDTLGGTDFVQIGLPDNQWMIEATEMFSVSMAKLQQQIISYATGPTHFHPGLEFIKGDNKLCRRQKIRGVSGYLSFSVLGVSIILIFGGWIIFTALVLDTTVGFVRRQFNLDDHKRLQWAVDEKLQLQRLAFEGAGQGCWSGGTDAVPTTSRDQVLGFGLDPDNSHPRLARNGFYSAHAAPDLCKSESTTTRPPAEKGNATAATRREIEICS